jgi:hypothetical protein
MAQPFTDEKTLEIAQKSVEKEQAGNIRSSMSHFIIDFNVISNSIAFIIALQSQKLISDIASSLSDGILIGKQHSIVVNLVSLILTFIICYAFIRLIFYKYIFTQKISDENIIKHAIVEKKKETAKGKINVDSFAI